MTVSKDPFSENSQNAASQKSVPETDLKNPAGPSKNASFLRALAAVSGLTMISRVLGFLRDMMMAGVLGTGAAADAFVVALFFPNLFRRLFGEGAFSSAFVPMFAGMLVEEGPKRAMAFASQAFMVLASFLLLLVLLFESLMPWVVQLVAPGFDPEGERFALAVMFMQVTTPYLLFICLVAMLGGILNSVNRFGALAATPILFNISLILGLLVGREMGSATAGYILSWAVCLSGLVQFLWMCLWCRKAKTLPKIVRPKVTLDIRTLGRRLGPAIFSHGVMQISLLVGSILASTLPMGAVSVLYYADRVNQLPLGVVGVAIATALLPKLSKSLKEAQKTGDNTQARRYQSRATEFALLLTLPAAVALAVIGAPIISVLFERGEFGPDDVVATAAALQVFAFGLPAFVAVKILQTGFFAREDTKTPFKAGVVTMVSYCLLALTLMQIWGHVGLALATSLSGWVNALLLVYLQHRRNFFYFDKRAQSVTPRLLLASALMGAAIFWGELLLADWFVAEGLSKYFALAGLVLGGGCCYAVALLGLRAITPREFKALLKGRMKEQ